MRRIAFVMVAVMLAGGPLPAQASSAAFATPEAAMEAFGDAVARSDEERMKALLGEDYRSFIPPVGAEVRYALLPKHRIADPALERRCVLSGGDDYELVFTAPPAQRAAIERLSGEPRLTRVGAILAGAATLRVLDERGAPIAVARGYDHFAA